MPPFQPPLNNEDIASSDREFKVIKPLRSGGQGAVFLIEHPKFGETVLKIIQPEYQIRTEREIETLSKIDNPATLKILESDYINVRGQRSLFTVTPYINGKDLEERIGTDGRLDELQIKQLLGSIAGVLDILWGERVVHRDIKPANILVDSDGRYILIDFGIARHLEETSITKTGFAIGTPGYMSPEQSYGNKLLTVKSDIFSLGITSYEALCGAHPFARNQLLITSSAPVAKPVDKIDCSEEMSEMILKMISYRPAMRPMPKQIIEIIEG